MSVLATGFRRKLSAPVVPTLSTMWRRRKGSWCGSMGMGSLFRWGDAEGEGEDSSTAAAAAPGPAAAAAVASRDAGDPEVGEDEESRGRTHSAAKNSLGLLASATMSGSSKVPTAGAFSSPSPSTTASIASGGLSPCALHMPRDLTCFVQPSTLHFFRSRAAGCAGAAGSSWWVSIS